jgi:hypothetical protein
MNKIPNLGDSFFCALTGERYKVTMVTDLFERAYGMHKVVVRLHGPSGDARLEPVDDLYNALYWTPA